MNRDTYDELYLLCLATILAIFNENDDQQEAETMADGVLSVLVVANSELMGKMPDEDSINSLKRHLVRDVRNAVLKKAGMP